MDRIQQTFDQLGCAEVPLHLRDAHYQGATKLGHVGYQYPHDFPEHFVKQQYLPEKIKDMVLFEASDQGMEARMKENQSRRRTKP
jgi:putative ATPase